MQSVLMGLCGICCCVWCIASIVVVCMSWTTLPQGEYALTYNWMWQTIGEDPLTEPGMFVQPFVSLVRYPSTYQIVYFDTFGGSNWRPKDNEVHREPVSSRTYDGLQLNLSASFQWRLEPDALKPLYHNFGGAEDIMGGGRPDWKPSIEEAFVRIARASLTEACARFTADDFFKNQTAVENVMFEGLIHSFNQPAKGLRVSIKGLQLRSVDLPDKYEDAIGERQQNEQDYDTAMAERETKKMTMSNNQMQAEQKQRQLLNGALGKAEQTALENSAWVEQFLMQQDKQSGSFGSLLQSLGGDYSALFNVMKQRAVREHEASKMTLAM